MRWRGEQRIVEEIFPVAGVLAARDDLRSEAVLDAAMRDDDDIVVDRGCGRSAALEVRDLEPAQRQDQAKARDLIIGERMPRHDRAVVGRQPHTLRLGYQVADGQNQPVRRDHRAVADALGAEMRGRKGLLGDLGVHQNDGAQCRVEIEPQLVALRPQTRGKRPVRGVGHGLAVRSDQAGHLHGMVTVNELDTQAFR